MLHYPKIPSTEGCPGGACIAFEKYDGTNLHWAWDRDFGWHAFGTRRDQFNLSPEGIRQFNEAHPGLEGCADLFQATLAGGLEIVFREKEAYAECTEVKVFTEFFGPRSFAGMHKPDEPKQLVLFDVLAEPFGLLGPELFVLHYNHLPSARVVYRGKFTGQFTEDVRRGKFGVAEGVVVKGGGNRGPTGDDLWMAKIKTDAYLARLKKAFADRWQDFWE
jgi:hypothetical protein